MASFGGGLLAPQAVVLKPSRPNPNLYQIDYCAVATGKRIANAKRRVSWKFGFANPHAMASGRTGADCRGREHEITLAWSMTSGKRVVCVDGQEIHSVRHHREVFDCSWVIQDGTQHELTIVAYAFRPHNAPRDFRQYDFFVDGQSYFTFSKLARLGINWNRNRNNPPPPNNRLLCNQPNNPTPDTTTTSNSAKSKEQTAAEARAAEDFLNAVLAR